MKSNYKIAIDGPSASGKGSVTKRVAQKLSLEPVYTGDMYRIVGLLSCGDVERAILIASNFCEYCNKDFEPHLLYSDENSRLTSEIAKNINVRNALVFYQKQKSQKGGVVMEGRDICDVVMPDADLKVYLDATPEARARRRFLQGSLSLTYDEILFAINERDKQDSNRQNSPLKISKDAIYIDTSNLTLDEVVDKVLSLIN